MSRKTPIKELVSQDEDDSSVAVRRSSRISLSQNTVNSPAPAKGVTTRRSSTNSITQNGDGLNGKSSPILEKRKTRRLSTESEIKSTPIKTRRGSTSKTTDEEKKAPSTPARRSTRISSTSPSKTADTPAKRTTRRSTSRDVDTTEENLPVRRSTRRSSVDEDMKEAPLEKPRVTRRRRSSSVDEEDNVKNDAVTTKTMLEPIEEQENEVKDPIDDKEIKDSSENPKNILNTIEEVDDKDSAEQQDSESKSRTPKLKSGVPEHVISRSIFSPITPKTKSLTKQVEEIKEKDKESVTIQEGSPRKSDLKEKFRTKKLYSKESEEQDLFENQIEENSTTESTKVSPSKQSSQKDPEDELLENKNSPDEVVENPIESLSKLKRKSIGKQDTPQQEHRLESEQQKGDRRKSKEKSEIIMGSDDSFTLNLNMSLDKTKFSPDLKGDDDDVFSSPGSNKENASLNVSRHSISKVTDKKLKVSGIETNIDRSAKKEESRKSLTNNEACEETVKSSDGQVFIINENHIVASSRKSFAEAMEVDDDDLPSDGVCNKTISQETIGDDEKGCKSEPGEKSIVQSIESPVLTSKQSSRLSGTLHENKVVNDEDSSSDISIRLVDSDEEDNEPNEKSESGENEKEDFPTTKRSKRLRLSDGTSKYIHKKLQSENDSPKVHSIPEGEPGGVVNSPERISQEDMFASSTSFSEHGNVESSASEVEFSKETEEKKTKKRSSFRLSMLKQSEDKDAEVIEDTPRKSKTPRRSVAEEAENHEKNDGIHHEPDEKHGGLEEELIEEAKVKGCELKKCDSRKSLDKNVDKKLDSHSSPEGKQIEVQSKDDDEMKLIPLQTLNKSNGSENDSKERRSRGSLNSKEAVETGPSPSTNVEKTNRRQSLNTSQELDKDNNERRSRRSLNSKQAVETDASPLRNIERSNRRQSLNTSQELEKDNKERKSRSSLKKEQTSEEDEAPLEFIPQSVEATEDSIDETKSDEEITIRALESKIEKSKQSDDEERRSRGSVQNEQTSEEDEDSSQNISGSEEATEINTGEKESGEENTISPLKSKLKKMEECGVSLMNPTPTKIKLDKEMGERLNKLISKKLEASKVDEDDQEGEVPNVSNKSMSEDFEEKNEFLDDQAEEGEEDTPSEGSNDIIDEGESIHSTESEYDTDETYDSDDSFIVKDDVVQELLSGEEYDLDTDDEPNQQEKKEKKVEKKRRIIPNSATSSDEEHEGSSLKVSFSEKVAVIPTKHDIAVKSSPFKEDKVRSPNKISPAKSYVPRIQVESMDKSSEESDKYEDDASIKDKTKFEKRLSSLIQSEKVSTPNSSFSDSVNTSKQNTSARSSSIIVHENINVKEIENDLLAEKLHQVVKVFCSGIRASEGNVSMNVSLDYVEHTQPSLNDSSVRQVGEKSPNKSRKSLDKSRNECPAEPISLNKRKSLNISPNRSVTQTTNTEEEITHGGKSSVSPKKQSEQNVTKKRKSSQMNTSSLEINNLILPNESLHENLDNTSSSTNKKRRSSNIIVSPKIEVRNEHNSSYSKKKSETSKTIEEKTVDETPESTESETNAESSFSNKDQAKTRRNKKRKNTETVSDQPPDLKISKKMKLLAMKCEELSANDLRHKLSRSELKPQSKSKVKTKKLKRLQNKIKLDLKKLGELVTDVKNRPRRLTKPSYESNNSDWLIEEDLVKPSTANLSKCSFNFKKFSKKDMKSGDTSKPSISGDMDLKAFDTKDFKNQMLYDPRIKREATSSLLKKRRYFV